MPLVQASYEQQIALLPEPSYDGPYDIDQDPVWQYQPQAPAFNALDWYQCDHLGTPLELTDQHGEMVWRADYQAWGQAQVRLSEAAQRRKLDTALRFQGQYLDVETGLHYNRYRYYDPQVGRFVSADPIGYAGGLNLYQYAPNPVEWVDPLGLAKKLYHTYTKTHPESGTVYSGRTCGCKLPEENIARRDSGHHMNKQGFGPAVLDKTSENPSAIRGREQILIDTNGKAQSMGGTSGNVLNGISTRNKNASNYFDAAHQEFGE
ncbi:RHS repeat domain-containing protein [Pseudomonas urmiensis]|uniref:RHS repeat domain-containing protein n=1 Tax=Pseudomonas urmiensis TaxID=2745493 RepID=UPI00386A1C5B